MKKPGFLFHPWDHLSWSCSICGRWTHPGRTLCTNCFRVLAINFFQVFEFSHPEMTDVRVRSLIEWKPRESDFLSLSLLSMKGNRAPASWNEFARAFLQVHGGQLFESEIQYENPSYIHFCPVPGKNGRHDHAWNFANSLSALLGWSLMTLADGGELKASPDREQKRKTRRERLEMAQSRERTYGYEVGSGYYVLVDDILTTGATTASLARCLGWPWKERPEDRRPRIEIWALAHRSRLAP